MGLQDKILCLFGLLGWGICRDFSADALAMKIPRKLPEKILIGYANNCDEKVINAIRDGVNVVVWAFLELQNQGNNLVPVTSLDLEKVRHLIQGLDEQGYDDTVHLISFGGWNGPHLETSGISPEEWYNVWKQHAGDIFHGIDWDLEGHDNLDSSTNVFSRECLDFMGRISQLGKGDGYIIGMAPPQSYLDVNSPRFSRYVNLTEANRPWHSEFHYFGANVYSYVLSKYGDYIDFVSVQFYESYSRAAMEIHFHRKSPFAYLESYVQELVANDQTFAVDFDDDPSMEYSSRRVSFPLSKLVLGFANGWAKAGGDKSLYVEPDQLATAYKNLAASGIATRGLMFWVIAEEGTKDVYYAKALNKVLEVRSKHEPFALKDEL